MDIIRDITKLYELGVTKTAIAQAIRVSRQLIDYRVKKKVDFSPQEKHLFYEKYRTLLN